MKKNIFPALTCIVCRSMTVLLSCDASFSTPPVGTTAYLPPPPASVPSPLPSPLGGTPKHSLVAPVVGYTLCNMSRYLINLARALCCICYVLACGML